MIVLYGIRSYTGQARLARSTQLVLLVGPLIVWSTQWDFAHFSQSSTATSHTAMDDDSSAAVVPSSVTPATNAGKKRSRTPNASPRSTMTMYSSKWERQGKKWWQTDERVEDGPHKDKITAKHCVTHTDIQREIEIGLTHFELERCDRDRYK